MSSTVFVTDFIHLVLLFWFCFVKPANIATVSMAKRWFTILLPCLTCLFKLLCCSIIVLWHHLHYYILYVLLYCNIVQNAWQKKKKVPTVCQTPEVKFCSIAAESGCHLWNISSGRCLGFGDLEEDFDGPLVCEKNIWHRFCSFEVQGKF